MRQRPPTTPTTTPTMMGVLDELLLVLVLSLSLSLSLLLPLVLPLPLPLLLLLLLVVVEVALGRDVVDTPEGAVWDTEVVMPVTTSSLAAALQYVAKICWSVSAARPTVVATYIEGGREGSRR